GRSERGIRDRFLVGALDDIRKPRQSCLFGQRVAWSQAAPRSWNRRKSNGCRILPARTSKYRVFPRVFAFLRTALQTDPVRLKLFAGKRSVGFRTEGFARFPSWTSPVRIRSPALDGKPSPNTS